MLRVMDDFEIRALLREHREHERHKWFIAAKHQKQQKEAREDRIEQDVSDLAASVILADPIEVVEFRADLQTYDAATIEAILENREILERLYQERDQMLAQAHQLDDGRRVFKTEDGHQVYDENGTLLSDDIITPDEISDHHPRAEPFLNNRRLIEEHETNDQRLIDYQEQLDETRDRLDANDLTQEELEALREGVETDMPIQVRQKLPDYDPSQETDLTSDLTSTAKQAAKLSSSDMAIDPSMVPGLR